MFSWQPTVDTYLGTVVLTLLVLLYISHHHYVLLAAHCWHLLRCNKEEDEISNGEEDGVREISIWNKFFFNVVVYFLRYMDKIVMSMIIFIGLVNGILRVGVKNGNRLCSNTY